jgi:hypothetical protein
VPSEISSQLWLLSLQHRAPESDQKLRRSPSSDLSGDE